MNEDQIIRERKEKMLSFLKEKYDWVAYIALAFLIWFAVWIRSLPMKVDSATGHSGLWDITTNHWTLGPDLDPFLFLRWTKYIVEHGSLMITDTMRYVPIGFNVLEELTPHVYIMAWFHKIAVFFGSPSVEYSAVIFPVFMFALTVVAFFLLSRKIFLDVMGKSKANLIAIISSFFLIVIPSLLPRTIAGIPEKESAGFFYLFITFYFFLCAWKSKSLRAQLIFALISGITTAIMAGVWGGYNFIFVTLGLSLFLALSLDQFDKNKIYISLTWLISSFLIMSQISSRYHFSELITSTTTLIPMTVISIAIMNYVLFNTSLKKYFSSRYFSKIPKPILSMIVFAILGIVLAIIFYGPSFISDKVTDITKPLIEPITDRLGVTVAENKQPYFDEWRSSFGSVIGGKNVALFFWLFFFGSVYLYYTMNHFFRMKEKIILTLSYLIFLFAIIFSRYSPNSIFNGVSGMSLTFYVFGVLCLVGTFGYYYWQYYKGEEHDRLKSINFGLILLFSFFFFSIVSARGAVRLVMMLVPSSSIIVGFLVVSVIDKSMKTKDESMKLIVWALAALIIFSAAVSGFQFTQQSIATAKNYIPNIYTQQWQLAMSWVRDNTPKDAVFGHWWDYGYWVQTMAERATVLDGGNSIPYWDHLMGRYGLTGPSSEENRALQFLYTHNTTHFLIDSTDIGKYPAFSSIGSDENYDRYSYMITMLINPQQTQENKNSTLYLYQGGVPTDSDIFYNDNGTKIALPEGKTGLGAVVVEKDKRGKIISAPIGIFIYQNKQYRIPLNYAFSNGTLSNFSGGIEAGVFLYPQIVQSQQGLQIVRDGAMIYLSKKTVLSQLTRLYLYKENDTHFELIHNEDDFAVVQLKAQGAIYENEDTIYYQGFRGPIRIWKINYPSYIKANPDFLLTDYPDKNLTIARR